MSEIIIAILIQLATILGGDADKTQEKEKENQQKTEQQSSTTNSTAEVDGGAGTWH